MLVEEIRERVRQLPPDLQREVLHFVEYLLYKVRHSIPPEERREWTDFSLASAVHDQDEREGPGYTEDDLKVIF